MSTAENRPAALDVDDEQVVIGEGVALDVRPAGFILRAGSAIIDVVTAGLVLYGAILLLATVLSTDTGSAILGDPAIITAVMLLTVVGVLVIAPAVVEILTHGKSLGRWTLGLRIVRDDGGAIGPRHAFIRSVVGFFEFWTTSGGLAILVGLLNPRSKRLGDILAGTYAQNERAKRPVPSSIALPVGLEGWAAIADVARLPDPTARRVRDYLAMAPKMEPAQRTAMAGRIARETARFVHPVPDVDADTFLRAVSVVRRDRESRALQLAAGRRERLAPALGSMPHGFPDRG